MHHTVRTHSKMTTFFGTEINLRREEKERNWEIWWMENVTLEYVCAKTQNGFHMRSIKYIGSTLMSLLKIYKWQERLQQEQKSVLVFQIKEKHASNCYFMFIFRKMSTVVLVRSLAYEITCCNHLTSILHEMKFPRKVFFSFYSGTRRRKRIKS